MCAQVSWKILTNNKLSYKKAKVFFNFGQNGKKIAKSGHTGLGTQKTFQDKKKYFSKFMCEI